MTILDSNKILAPYFCRTRGIIKSGAQRMHALCPWILDSKTKSIPLILVGGSNGKGTTCAFLEQLLRTHNDKTGLYTSPHLVHPNERIRIDGTPVDENSLAAALQTIELRMLKSLPDATFFEIMTAAALEIFYKNGCTAIVFEVGLGGHFDSTNAINPLLSVLTSVSLEHTDILGKDIFTIARDKTHICRRNKNIIFGNLESNAFDGFLKTASKIGARAVFANGLMYPEDSLLMAENRYFRKISGFGAKINELNKSWLKLNIKNIEIALTAFYYFQELRNVILADDFVLQALSDTFWPGRFDVRTINKFKVIFDGSHNCESVEFFLEQLKNSEFNNRKFTIVYGSLADKNWNEVLNSLSKISNNLILTQPDSPRAVNSIDLLNKAPNSKNTFSIPELKSALEKAFDLSDSTEDVIIITGSIVLIGQAMEILNVSPFDKGEVII